MLAEPFNMHAAGLVPAAMGEPTRLGVAWTLPLLLLDAAPTPVLAQTAQSERSMMAAIEILNILLVCFIQRFTSSRWRAVLCAMRRIYVPSSGASLSIRHIILHVFVINVV
jgi:hypothetical protein